jgi:hypothetical protein
MNRALGRLSRHLGLVALLAGSVSGALAQDVPAATLDNPSLFEATYLARALGMSATAYRAQSSIGENTYRIENRLTLELLGATVGTVSESSEFRWNGTHVVPLQYCYSQTGLSSREEAVSFDWDAMTAQSTLDDESWTLPLQTGVQDKLSYSQSIRYDIGARALTEIAYAVADSDEIDEQVYRVSAREVIDTPLGPLNTVRIDRVRSDDSRRRTTVWLATDWHYLLVKLEQVSGSGTETSLSLEAATVNGETLRGF